MCSNSKESVVLKMATGACSGCCCCSGAAFLISGGRLREEGQRVCIILVVAGVDALQNRPFCCCLRRILSLLADAMNPSLFM